MPTLPLGWCVCEKMCLLSVVAILDWCRFGFWPACLWDEFEDRQERRMQVWKLGELAPER